MTTKTATTVKIDPTLYDKFKVMGIGYKLTFQGLVERCIYRYVNEEPFRESINLFRVPLPLSEASGSVLTLP